MVSGTVGVLRVNDAWSVVDANPAAERLLGRARAELAGPLYRSAALAPFFEALKHATDECRWGYARTLELARDGACVHLAFRVVLERPEEDLFHGALLLIEEVGALAASCGTCAEGLARQLRDTLMSVLAWAEVVRNRLASDPRASEDLGGLMSAIESCHLLIERSLDSASREEGRSKC